MFSQLCSFVISRRLPSEASPAALELTLMRPDRPLFEWRAPGYRQQRLLRPAAATKPG
jgi:hypothetical protein